jgi:hypothetical protein
MKKIKEKFKGFKIGGDFGGNILSKNVEDLSGEEINMILENGGGDCLRVCGEDIWEVVNTEGDIKEMEVLGENEEGNGIVKKLKNSINEKRGKK